MLDPAVVACDHSLFPLGRASEDRCLVSDTAVGVEAQVGIRRPPVRKGAGDAGDPRFDMICLETKDGVTDLDVISDASDGGEDFAVPLPRDFPAKTDRWY